jgi:hypothetical protein
MDRLMHVLTGFGLLILFQVLSSVRRSHIRVEYSVSWLIAALVLLLLSLDYKLVKWLAELLGVQSPPVAILMVMLAVFIMVFYRFSLRISALKDANVALTQRLAILEYHLKANNEGQETNTRD